MVRYSPLGDKGLLVEFGKTISQEISEKVLAFRDELLTGNVNDIIEVCPAYCSLAVLYDPTNMSYDALVAKLKMVEREVKSISKRDADIFEIPVCYDGVYAPDIDFVAQASGLSVDDVIKVHTSKPYMIYMLGFMPGFAFLGGLDRKLSVSRRESPRVRVPAGSVGVISGQTGVYPIESPGGWQLIGRTPLKLFDHSREKPILFEAGDYIRFSAISQEEYEEMTYVG